MSELTDVRIDEFRERAELGVSMPDLARLERRGAALRRRRTATAVGALALAVVAGFGVAGSFSGSPDASPVPANPAPSETPSLARVTPGAWEAGVRKTTQDNGEELLEPGRSVVRYGDLQVTFDTPSSQWEWYAVGAGLRLGSDPDDYATTVFWLPDPTVRLGTCDQDRAASLGTDPGDLVGNVRPLLDLVSSRVVEPPRQVAAFGGQAAYLQLSLDTSCPPGGRLPAQLRGLANGEVLEPGWEGPHLVDLWHVVRGDRSILVAAWHLGGTPAQAVERQQMVDSIRVTAID